MTSLPATFKDEPGKLTDAEENQQSEGENQKRSNSGSPENDEKNTKLRESKVSMTERNNHSNSNMRNQNEKHITINVTSKQQDEFHTTSASTRPPSLEPPKMHLLQPHSHRRHFTHHLKDHFSSPVVCPSPDKDVKKEINKEIIPATESCEYKDTNFLTEGSPPRTPILRPYLKARSLLKEDVVRKKHEVPLKGRKPAQFLAASYWKEPPDRVVQYRSSSESDSSESGKNAKYFNKYKNESVSGPQTRSGDNCHGFTFSKARLSPEEIKTKYCGKSSRFNNEKNKFDGKAEKSLKTFSNCPKKLSCGSTSKSRPLSFSNSQRFTKNGGKNDIKGKRFRNHDGNCPVCTGKKPNLISCSTQTELPDITTTTMSKPIKDVEESVIEKCLASAEMSLCAFLPCSESSESNSVVTEDTSSISIDDDVINFNFAERQVEKVDGSYDVLRQLNKIQTDMQQFTKTINSNQEENQNTLRDFYKDSLESLKSILLEIAELYDHFDPEENNEHLEFNELRKQLREYKRNCRILEHDLINSNAKLEELNQSSDLQDEIRMTHQLSVALYCELQNADAKLTKITSENDALREKLTSDGVQREVLEREVMNLRNTVDQMSLHASSVRPNESLGTKPRDSDGIAELCRQLQFQQEEKKVILRKLMETNKERDEAVNKLEKYVLQYGEIPSTDSNTNKKDENNLNYRLGIAEEQVGMLGRKLIELEIENEKLKLQENKVHPSPIAELSSRLSLSDMQFLEDEVETLRVTLEEAEKENGALKYKLKQYQEKASLSEDKFQTSQTALYLKGQVTPTISDKIAVWDTFDPGTPQTICTNSDFTISGTSSVPVLTAIDACTQTYFDFPKRSPSPRIRSERPTSFRLSKEITEILNRSGEEDADIESLVGQLANLAIATRHLVDESSSLASSTRDLHSSTPTSGDDQNIFFLGQYQQNNFDDVMQSSSQTTQTSFSKEETQPSIYNFQTLLFLLIVYTITSSLPITTNIKLGIFCILFSLL